MIGAMITNFGNFSNEAVSQLISRACITEEVNGPDRFISAFRGTENGQFR
jgi:hypothetical protein